MSDMLIPPEDLRTWVGPFLDPEVFLASGKETVALARSMCALRPEEAVLDVGCGSGRVAVALTDYLSPAGSYVGFDVAERPIRWCKEQIEPRYPNFHFVHLDVHHSEYNPNGTFRPETVRFPCGSAVMDLVVASSILTHLLAPEAEHYVSEFARALRPGGRCLISYLLMDHEAQRAVATGTTIFDLRYRVGPAWSFSAENPTEGVAYPEEYAFAMLHSAGLQVEEVRRGDWRMRRSYEIQHDWVAVRKLDGVASPCSP